MSIEDREGHLFTATTLLIEARNGLGDASGKVFDAYDTADLTEQDLKDIASLSREISKLAGKLCGISQGIYHLPANERP